MKSAVVTIVFGCSLLAFGLVQGCGGGSGVAKYRVATPAPKVNLSTGSHPNPKSTPGNHQVVLGSDLIGKISTVSAAGHYVVLTFPVGVMPAEGVELGVFRQAVAVGKIRVTGPRRDIYTVADILQGDCQPGDEVRIP